MAKNDGRAMVDKAVLLGWNKTSLREEHMSKGLTDEGQWKRK